MKIQSLYRTLYIGAMSRRFQRIGMLSLAMLAACVVFPVMATPNLGDLSGDMSGQADSVANLAVVGFALLGIIVGGVGLHKITQARKTQEGMGVGIGMFVVGAVLVSLPLAINVMSTSTLGSDASGLQDLDIQ